jgi:hypothetical protein
VSTTFGAFALYRLGTDSTTIGWVTTFVLSCGALGGWIHHPVRRFRRRGAIAGLLAAGGAFWLAYLYVNWRGGEQNLLGGEELFISIAIGAAPGVYLYYRLLRDEQVEAWEQLPRNDPS